MGEKGIYAKYHIERTDGKPMNAGFRFVLSPENDPVALEALKVYAKKTDNRLLANDLKNIIWDIEHDMD